MKTVTELAKWRDENPMKFDNNYRECKQCFNSGWNQVTRHDVIGRPYRGAIRCQSCDYWMVLIDKFSKVEHKR